MFRCRYLHSIFETINHTARTTNDQYLFSSISSSTFSIHLATSSACEHFIQSNLVERLVCWIIYYSFHVCQRFCFSFANIDFFSFVHLEMQLAGLTNLPIYIYTIHIWAIDCNVLLLFQLFVDKKKCYIHATSTFSVYNFIRIYLICNTLQSTSTL